MGTAIRRRRCGFRAWEHEVCPHGQAGDCYYVLRSAAEEAVLRSLVKDAIERAIKAYGSQALFGKKACTPSQLAGSESTAVVLQELEKFCGEAALTRFRSHTELTTNCCEGNVWPTAKISSSRLRACHQTIHRMEAAK